MKKLLLGLCLVFGVEYANADMCKLYFDSAIEELNKANRALKLELLKEAESYLKSVNYYTKKVVVTCPENDARFKAAKEVLVKLGEIK